MQIGSVKLKNLQVEIPVQDLQRAKKFYEKYFGFVVKEQDEEYIEFENNMLLRKILSSPKKSDLPCEQKVRILFCVDKISIVYKELIDAGIRAETPPFETEQEYYLFFLDSEDNCCKVSQKK